MKINGNEIRPGNIIQHKGALWVTVKTQHVKPGKGPAYAQVELKNAIDGTKLNERFRSSETVERVRLEQKDYQFLFHEGDMLVFMDMDTYDQISIRREFLEERAAFLQDGMQVTVESHEGTPIAITLPDQVTLQVVSYVGAPQKKKQFPIRKNARLDSRPSSEKFATNRNLSRQEKIRRRSGSPDRISEFRSVVAASRRGLPSNPKTFHFGKARAG